MGFETDRLAPQLELVPPARLASMSVSVIGVGAIGRQAALQLASLGVRQVATGGFRFGGTVQHHHPGIRPRRLGPGQGRSHRCGDRAAGSCHPDRCGL